MSIPLTESENPNTSGIDELPVLEALGLINVEDSLVAKAVGKTLPDVAGFIAEIVPKIRSGGRLFYVGTGTSGRLGVLDAAEIPPTFGVSPDMIQGVIAGGYEALYKAVEVSEDNKEGGADDLEGRGLSADDSVIGIAASGRTPYTIGAVEYARSLGCLTACITSDPRAPIVDIVDFPLVAEVGPEVIAGSTRMKSGTAQKLILNMISTLIMVRLGHVKGNKMVDVKPGNKKLIARRLRMLMDDSGMSEDEAEKLLASAKDNLKIALVMSGCGCSPEEAEAALSESESNVAAAIKKLRAT